MKSTAFLPSFSCSAYTLRHSSTPRAKTQIRRTGWSDLNCDSLRPGSRRTRALDFAFTGRKDGGTRSGGLDL